MSAIVTRAEVFSVFRKWRDEPTRLRVFAIPFGSMQFSVDCTLGRVDEPIVALDLSGCGFIEFLLDDEGLVFAFGAADAMRIPPTERIGESSHRMKKYEFGEMVAVVKDEEHRLGFLEIVRELD